MSVRVGINGFGRIGRNILRAIVESGRKDIEVVGINDLGSVEANAHLLRYDSVHGRFPHKVTVEGDTDAERFLLGSIEERVEGIDIISPGSALGIALVGHSVGETVAYETPAGLTLRVDIVSVGE